MRAFVCFALLLPCPALADVIAATSRITGVTVYPQGAEVTREVVFAAPVGAHDLLITDLPASTEPTLLRIAPAAGLQAGAYALRTDRLPPRADPASVPQQAARDVLKAAQAALRAAQSGVAAVAARIEAAEAQVAFLRGVAGPMPETATPEGLQAISRMIGAEVLAARAAVIAAQGDLFGAQDVATEAEKAVSAAQEAYDALAAVDRDYAALSVAVTAAQAGETRLTVTHFIADASWRPVYDIRLTRAGAAPALTIARGALVSQGSGEDWQAVAMTLSTAQPSEQAEPTQLWPELRRIGAPPDPMAKGGVEMAPAVVGATAEMAMDSGVVAEAALIGDVVVYRYPGAVDVATGVEDLRLALDEIALEPQVVAQAVPRSDATAFVMARITNTSGEILLPGNAFLLRDGVLVGGTYLEKIAPGDEARIAFGPIESLRLTRDMPVRAAGDRGILSQSSQIEEVAVLKLENLGAESWPVRLLDLVPYSEQEDLEVAYTADPAPSDVDVDGQRGILAWEFDLAPGEVREVRLTHSLRWPEGMELQ